MGRFCEGSSSIGSASISQVYPDLRYKSAESSITLEENFTHAIPVAALRAALIQRCGSSAIPSITTPINGRCEFHLQGRLIRQTRQSACLFD